MNPENNLINPIHPTGNQLRERHTTPGTSHIGCWRSKIWSEKKTRTERNIFGVRNTDLKKAGGSVTIQKIMLGRPVPHQALEEKPSNQDMETTTRN